MALVSPKTDSLPSSRKGSQENRLFSIRIVNFDYYTAPPLPELDLGYSTFQGRTIEEVPVVRIFGSTTAGQKTCLHLHRIFPYFYVPYEDDLPQDVNEAFAYVRCLGLAIEQAMKMSSRAAGKKQHVHCCSLVRGRRYYGYHPNEQLFVKIVLYHPQDVPRITALLTAGGIMNRKFQPHESHIPYLLQFLIDHNLSGMAHIHLAKVRLRHPLPDHSLDRAQLLKHLKESLRKQDTVTQAGKEGRLDILVNQAKTSTAYNDSKLPGGPPSSLSVGDESNVWLKNTVPVEWIWTSDGDAAPSRHSACELEGDGLAEDILNKRDLLFVPLQTAGPDIRTVQSLVPIWEEELQRTGEEGAAGSLAQSSPGERVLPPIASHEQAMRNVLLDIVREFESRHAGTGNTQDGSPLKGALSVEVAAPSEVTPDNMGEVVQNQALEIEEKSNATLEQRGLGRKEGGLSVTSDQVSSVSPQRKARDMWIAGSLLKCTQAANVQEISGPQDEARLPQDWIPGSGEIYFPGQDHMQGLVNEEIVKEQFTQASEPQGTEKEVLDLLCWMGGAQDEIDVEASDDGDEQCSQELEFSQMFRSSGVQAALTRALSAYEVASNAECQEILSCYTEGKDKLEAGSSEEEGRHDQGLTESSDEDSITSLNPIQAGAESWQRSQSPKSGEHMDHKNDVRSSQAGPTIPQVDGQYDEQNDIDTKGAPCCSGDRPMETETPELTIDLDSMSSSHPQLVRASSLHPPKGLKRKTSSILQTSKLPAVRATKPQVSWCTLPVTGVETASAASGHKSEERLPSGKELSRPSIAETGLCGETSKLNPERSSSLRALMRRRRGRKRKQREAGHQNETSMPVDATEPKRIAGMEVSGKSDEMEQTLTGKWDTGLADRGDNRDCGGGQKHDDGSVLGQEGALSLREPALETGYVHKFSLLNTSCLPEDQENLSFGFKSTLKGDNRVDLRHDELPFVGNQFSVSDTVCFHDVKNVKLRTRGEGHEHSTDRERCVSEDFSPRKVCETLKQAVCYSNNPGGDVSVVFKKPQTQCRSFGGAQHGSDHEASTSTFVSNADSISLQSLKMKSEKMETAHPKTQLDRTGKVDLEPCPGESSFELGLQVPAGHVPPAESDEQRDGEKDLAECTPKQDCDSDSWWRKGRSSLMSYSTLPVYQDDASETLYSLRYNRKPPSPAHCLDTFSNHGLNSEEHGTVFFGNVKDVSAQPTVMAGLVFHWRSKEGVHLPPFLFGSPGKVSRSEQASKEREYVETELWGLQQGGDGRMGVPVHFENDGSMFYVLTPARSPPSCSAVQDWLQQKTSKGGDGPGKKDKQVFTVDPNTGKLVALEGDAQTQTTQSFTQGSLEDNEYYRPASPKYDEKHVLTVPFTSTDHHLAALSVDKNLSVQRLGGKMPPDVNTKTHNPGSNEGLLNAQDEVIGGEENQGAKKDHASSIVLGEAIDTTKDIAKLTRQWRDVSQITAPVITAAQITPLSQSGFRDPASEGGGQQLTLASIEIYVQTRGDLRPDPRYDAIGCIIIVFQDDHQNREQTTFVLIRDETCWLQNKNVDGITSCELIYLPNEAALFSCLVQLVKLYDPDILIGWEIQRFSLGLLAERASNIGIGLLKQLSRTQRGKDADLPGQQDAQRNSDKSLFEGKQVETTGANEPIIDDEWGRTHGSGIYVGGRIVLNLWRIMRGEVKLGIYSLEAVAELVLRRRVPRIPWRTLSEWFSGGPGGARFRCLEYFVDRARLNLQIMDQLDLVNRTAELARIFGIDFFSVFSRGSQYRVESMMLRLAHTQNFLMVSPSKQQVAAQPAMECLPLVMEPESRFYTSPVVVLDFQSLYPSIIIAYNLCFSTSLGKIVSQNPKQLGVTSMYVQPALLAELKEKLILTPNGVMFTPPEVCRGVLPRLLDEILSTRIMVKKAMKKLAPKERVRQRVLNARQFALKLIANVTYGYTAAGFSGRMPFAELADSIVQLGRITLERAIHLVNAHPTWGARVVYGDTDSLFVLLEGRTREQAFKIGQEIASTVTAGNPPPIVLKMEKVYHPCVLLTKKRYVGYSYESVGQQKPFFDAKGIETVRRDSCAAVRKTMESCLRILFESKDLSKVKQYLRRQWGKIISGRISVRDFIFAKEVRLGTYSANASVLPPAAIVASKAMSVDPRAEPLYGERIPYVVIHGEPGARLVDMVVDPHTLLSNPLTLRLHDIYYITKQIIPALQRIFGLVGVELKVWYNEMPRVYQLPSKKPLHPKGKSDLVKLQYRATHRATIDNYYLSRHCPVCGTFTRGSGAVCPTCSKDPMLVTVVMTGRTSQLERELKHLETICRHCGGDDGKPERKISCVSLDCPVFFERRKADTELQSAVATQLHACTSPHGLLQSELF